MSSDPAQPPELDSLISSITGKPMTITQDPIDPLSACPVDPRYPIRWEGRRPLPTTRHSITHKIVINGERERFKGFLTVGLYPDGTPGELFLTVDAANPETRGALRDLATMASILLQYGCPIGVIVKHLTHHRYEPAGFTGNSAIPIAKSPSDYIGRWLAATFLPSEQQPAGTTSANT